MSPDEMLGKRTYFASYRLMYTSPLHYRVELKFITEDCRGHVFFIHMYIVHCRV